MTPAVLWALIGFGAIVVLVWLIAAWRRKPDTTQQNFLALHEAISQRLDRVTAQLDERLRENTRTMNEHKSFLADRVSTAERTVREVSAGLGKLEQATTALQRTNDEISSFQKMLMSPKVRGSFGEVMLGNLLAEVLPADRYALQHHFRSTGEIADAIIRLQDSYIVAIDAKFPLANYSAYVKEASTSGGRVPYAALMRDVKKHISDIAQKYISPREHTLDYAFMYIPSEGVYYETMVHPGTAGGGDPQLWTFSLQHHVIPVSPNSFLAYLQTVLVGLRGMKIQQQAKEILRALQQARLDFGRFAKDFTMIGTHLANAKNRHDDAARQLDRFSHRLEQLETGTQTPQLEENSEQFANK